jgi:hypothetical protein
MIDPVNSETTDGTACEACGEAADRGLRLINRAYPVPLCSDCAHDLTTKCRMCERTMWQSEGERIFSTSDLYCRACAKPWITAHLETAAKKDSERDTFNERRR